MSNRFSRLLATIVSLALICSASIASAATKPGKGAPPPTVPGAKKASKIQAAKASAVRPASQPAGSSHARIETILGQRADARKALQTGPRAMRPDELIVKYKTGTTAAQAAAARGTVKGEVIRKLNYGAELIRLPKGTGIMAAAASMVRSSNVEYAEPNYILTRADFTVDPDFGLQWGLENNGQLSGPGFQLYGNLGIDIGAREAWQYTMGDPSVVVAVIDEGVNLGHPDLAGHEWVNPGEICNNGADDDGNGYADDCYGWDFYNSDNTVYDPADGDFHGTHVAGIIAASMNGKYGVGVAPNVKILPLKFLGPEGGVMDDAVRAIEYAARMGVKITNNSYAGPYSRYMEDAIKAHPDMLFVVAAGNHSLNLDGWGEKEYPGAFNYPNVISVAAATNQGNLAYFSNFGANTVDVAAPGIDIRSTAGGVDAAPAIYNATPTYKSVFWGFGIEDLAPAEAQAAVKNVLDFFGAGADTPITVVLDDAHTQDPDYYPDMAPRFAEALVGYTNVTYQPVAVGASPAPLNPATAPVVIWTTGRDFGMGTPGGFPLTGPDLANINAYLQAGGKLLLTGQDAIFLNEQDPVITNALGVRWVAEGDPRVELEGFANTPFQNTHYVLTPYPFGDNFRDLVEVTPGHATAKKALVWFPRDSGYMYMHGTSQAAPHVAGIAALLQSVQPDMTAAQMRTRIMETAMPQPSLGGLVASGLANAARALSWSPDDDQPGVPFPGWGSIVRDTLDGATNTDLDDVYRVHLRAGERIRVELHGAPGTDFDLYLFAPNTPTVSDVAFLKAASEHEGSDEVIEYVAEAEGDYLVDAFAYAGRGEYTLQVMWGNGPDSYEDSHSALVFDTPWQTKLDAAASGGSYKFSPAGGNTMSFKFYGETVTIFAVKGPNHGLATVWMDGEIREIDLYAPTMQYNVPVYTKTGLVRGPEHELRVTNKGLRSPLGRKTAIGVAIDRLEVALDNAPPAPIAQLLAKPGNNQVTLTWPAGNTEPDFRGWNVYRAMNGGAAVKLTANPLTPSDVMPITTAKLTMRPSATQPGSNFVVWIDKTVQNGNSYTYFVTAVDTAGNESAPSPTATATPDQAPAPVSGLTVLNGNEEVTLTWNANTESDMLAYDIYRRAPNDPGFLPLRSINHVPGQAQYGYVDTGLTNEMPYDYVVVAVDTNEIQSDTRSVTGHPSLPPADPTGVNGRMDPNGISLWWDPTYDPYVSFTVVRTGANSPTVKFRNLWQSTLFDDTVPSLTQSYTYTVYAVDEWGVMSGGVSVTVDDTLAPAAPYAVTTEALEGAVKLTWSFGTEPDLAAFRISAYTPDGLQVGFQELPKPATGTTASFVMGGLVPGVTHRFELRSVDARGNASAPAMAYETPRASGPQPPTGLTALPGDNTVELHWSPVPNVDGYNVHLGNQTFWTVEPYYLQGGLSNGIEYCFNVASVRAGIESPWQQICGTPVDNIRPDAPVLSIDSVVGGVALSWTASQAWDVRTYLVYRDDTLVMSIPANTRSYFDPVAFNGPLYTYWVVAQDDDGLVSDRSNAYTVQPHDGLPPEAPNGLSNTVGDTSVTLSWWASNSPDVTHYEIWQKDGWDQPATRIAVVPNVTTFTVSNLMSNATYFFAVRAQDFSGMVSPETYWVEATPGTGPVWTGDYGATNGRIRYTGSWTTDLSDQVYHGTVRRGHDTMASAELTFDGNQVVWYGFKSADGGQADVFIDGTKVATVDQGSTTGTQWGQALYTSPVLGSGTHTIRIANAMPSAVSPGGFVTTVEKIAVRFVDLPPAAPASVTATAGDGQVTVAWAAVNEADMDGYNVYRSTAPGALGTKLNGAPLKSLFWTDNSVTNGTTYYYMVKAIDLGGKESAPSNQVSATPFASDTTPPTAPSNLTATAGNGTITVNWTASTDNSGVAPTYRVYWSTGSTVPATWNGPISVTSMSYTHSALTNGTTYWYKLVAVDGSGNTSVFSNAVYAMPNTAGVNGGMYENVDTTAIAYMASWTHGSDSLASGGSIAYSNAAGAEAKIRFTGTGIEWWALKSKYYGLIKVYVDGVEWGTVDLYSAANQYRAVVADITGLSSGVHEVRIVRTGNKNINASGAYISLDAFKVK